jgi:hypothetical protein
MEAKNLRIGNYVIVDNDIRIEHLGLHKITELRDLDCQVRLNDMGVYGQYYKFIKPIPITEELLESLGFKKTDKKDAHVINIGEYDLYVACNSFSGTLTKDPSWYCSVATGYASQPMTLIKKYVHDLQNLFFALAGTELEIKQDVSACS